MKLIDLLKQELPKHGGWPDGVNGIEMHDGGCTFFDGEMNNSLGLPLCSDGWRIKQPYQFLKDGTFYSNAVTREQYEAATWIPPVGTECEYHDYKGNWHKIFIIARYGDGTFIEWRSDTYTGCDLIRGEVSPDKFRPIRTEREKGIEAMLDIVNARVQRSLGDVIEQLYDAGYRKV